MIMPYKRDMRVSLLEALTMSKLVVLSELEWWEDLQEDCHCSNAFNVEKFE